MRGFKRNNMDKKSFYADLEKFKSLDNPEDIAAFEAELVKKHSNLSADEMMENLGHIDNRLSELEAIVELGEIADMASMSYIAKKYFNKSRSWLCQRLNGNLVNGKPAHLTEEERKTLAYALEDMSRQFKEKSLSILNG